MAKTQKGSLMLLKIGNGGSPSESFTTIGGMRTTQLNINRQPVNDGDVESGVWRSLMSGAGAASVRIRGAGLFADDAAQDTLLAKALNGASANYQFWFANGDRLTGAFIITAYERSGSMNDAEGFTVTLESAGAPSFISS